MEWRDEGFVIESRRHGENGLILQVLTRDYGRHAGLARGGASKTGRAVYMTGNRLDLRWTARISDQLGTYSGELITPHAAEALETPEALAALTSACALLSSALPEREPHPAIFEGTEALFGHLGGPAWAAAYIRWELGVLEDLGYGLLLDSCAATGDQTDLIYVSPKSGRAVSRAAGEPYASKLLPLPAFLGGADQGAPLDQQLADGLRLTGWFIAHRLTHRQGDVAPTARERLVEMVRRDLPEV